MPFHSIRFRTSLFTAILMAVVVGIVSSSFILTERKKDAADILQNGRALAEFSAPSIYDAYAQFYGYPEGFEPFKTRVNSLLELNRDVTDVTILGVNGRIMFDSSELTTGRYSGTPRKTTDTVILEDLAQTKTTHRNITLKNGKAGIAVTVPINETGLGHVLSVRYLISYESLTQRTQAIFIETASIAIPLLGFVILMSVLFAVTITRPIVKLTRVARQIQAGNFQIKTNITAKDEIGQLSRTIDEMTTQLQRSYSKLNKSLRQITNRTDQLTEEHARFTASIDSLPLGFMMTDAHDRVLTTNTAMQEILNSAARSGQPNPILQALMAGAKTCLLSKKPMTPSLLTHRDHIYRLFFSPVLLNDNSQTAIGTAILLEDITEEQILARSRDEFFSIASHELRTPLTAIRGNSSLILNYFRKSIKDNNITTMITDIHEASIRLIKIVNDFLDVSRLEQNKMDFQKTEFSLAEVINAAVKDLDILARERGLKLQLDNISHLPLVVADRDRTSQVLYNLIGNAIKFTNKGKVVIRAEIISTRHIKVFVEDTGKGITKENQLLLFRKFQQATDSILTRDNTQGTGLGLYISKLLVGRMGGKLLLEHSEEGKGSTFSITLPIAKPKNNSHKDIA